MGGHGRTVTCTESDNDSASKGWAPGVLCRGGGLWTLSAQACPVVERVQEGNRVVQGWEVAEQDNLGHSLRP